MPRAEDVLSILMSQEESLSALAALTDVDPFVFYQSADLRGLDLSEQDLRGLNFAGADLRGVDLNRVIYDLGAFNYAHLDVKLQTYKDGFEFSIEEYLKTYDDQLSLFWHFCSIRPQTLAMVIGITRRTFGQIAFEASISEATLRNARRGQTVNAATAYSILRVVVPLFESSIADSLLSINVRSLLRQPSLALYTSSPRGLIALNREHIDEVARLLALARSQ